MRISPAFAVLAALMVVGVGAAAWYFGEVRGYKVALTSRSMSHSDLDLEGVLDPGEKVAAVPVGSPADVIPGVDARRAGGPRVGDDWGDVLVFRARRDGGDAGVGIVHRAIVWVEYDAATSAYDVPSLGLQDVTEFVVPDVGTWIAREGVYAAVRLDVVLDPDLAGRHSGWLTKGDHNVVFDQDARSYSPLDGAAGGFELVEVAATEGRVVDFLEPHESIRIALTAFGAAFAACVAIVLLRRPARRMWGRLRAEKGCPACGAALQASDPFCVRCGRGV